MRSLSLKSKFLVNCPCCEHPILRQEGEELVFKGRVIKFPMNEKSQGIAKCRTCKQWVTIPVILSKS